MDAAIEHQRQPLDHLRPQTGYAAAERVEPHAHCRAHHFLRRGIADAAAVRQDGAVLVQVGFLNGYLVVLVFAEACVEAVNGGRVLPHPFALHIGAYLRDMRHAGRVDLHGIAAARDVDYILDLQVDTVQNYLFHHCMLLLLLFSAFDFYWYPPGRIGPPAGVFSS